MCPLNIYLGRLCNQSHYGRTMYHESYVMTWYVLSRRHGVGGKAGSWRQQGRQLGRGALTATQQPAGLQLIRTSVPPPGYQRTMGPTHGYHGTLGSTDYRTIEVQPSSTEQSNLRGSWSVSPPPRRTIRLFGEWITSLPFWEYLYCLVSSLGIIARKPTATKRTQSKVFGT